MTSHRVLQEDGRVLFAAAAVWATVMAAAATEGVTAKFDAAELAVLGSAIAIFAALACRIDEEVRAFMRSRAPRLLAAIASAGILALVLAIASHAASLAIFIAPIASAALAGWLDRRPGPAPRKAPARSPGARRAAT